MESRQYCVYMHVNKLDGKIYVGATRQSPERRWQKGAGYQGTYFGKAIEKHGWNAFEHRVLAVGLTKEEAFAEEKRLISKYRSSTPECGYNVSAGGYADDCLPRLSGLDHWNHARVRAIDPASGEVVGEYDTQSAAAKELGIERRGITKACRGLCQSYKGYVWEYVEREFKKPITHNRGCYDHKKQRKPVKLVDVDGVVYEFNSVKSAAAFVGAKGCTVSRYISGLREDASGRRWSFC